MVIIFAANIYLLIANQDKLRLIILTTVGVSILILVGLFHEQALYIIGRHSSVASYPILFFIFLFLFVPFIHSVDGSVLYKKVFLSYSRKDADFAIKLKNRMVDEGISIRIDKDDIRPGESIESFVRDSINNSALTVLIISKNSLFSSWVAFEAKKVADREWISGDSEYLIPCNIEKKLFDPEFPKVLYEQIEQNIARIQGDIRDRQLNNRSSQDLNDELLRAEKVKTNLDKLLHRLKETSMVDYTKDSFESNTEKLISEIQRRIRTL